MIYPKLSAAINQFTPTPQQKGQLKYWSSKLGDYRINQITPEMIRENLPNQGPATKNRYLSALFSIFNNFYTGDNPVSKVKRFREPRDRVRFLSDNERIRLLEACKKSRNPHIYPLVVISLSTGCRKMELLKLTWSQVDLDRGLIYLTDTKNGENRMVPIQGHSLQLVSELRIGQPQWCKYVFPNRYGSFYRDMDYHWRKVLGESGITDFRWHDLRHSCASYLSQQGVQLVHIKEILGHKSLSSTMRYVHLNASHLRGAPGNLNDMMFPDV